MALANPTVTGAVNGGPTGSSCNVDTFKAISGTSTAASTPPNPPTLCGVLDGSHSKKKTRVVLLKWHMTFVCCRQLETVIVVTKFGLAIVLKFG
jgi:hypothetical protein